MAIYHRKHLHGVATWICWSKLFATSTSNSPSLVCLILYLPCWHWIQNVSYWYINVRPACTQISYSHSNLCGWHIGHGFINWFLKDIHSQFDMQNLGFLKQFLGIDFSFFDSAVVLSQESYAKSTLEKSGMTTCKPCSTPMSTKKQDISQDDPLYYDPSFYRSIVRGLQYLTITSPDLSFAVNCDCQQLHEARVSDF